MGRYRIVRTKEAAKDLAKILKSGNKSDIKKVEIFFSEIEEHPRAGKGLPEQLKYFDGEVWSRRINKKDRFVYEIFEEDKNVIVVSSLGHYSDN
ncbi:Txe/YoeB family addiction module toxin [Epilithonimonas sp. UC225_85]|uniref:Txe/YoeB family addiction module toxin n=1 Tax=Epilithonimonas sp. UC225_85 TaxID=3350167 RepID=UPI0036D24894